MAITDNKGIKNYFEHKNNVLVSKLDGELYDPAELQKRKYTARQKSKFEWVQLLTNEGYNTLATIQFRMRNKFMFEDKMRHLSEHPRTRSLFYAVEQNADGLGYHIHLMLKATKVDSYNLSYALDIPPSCITYYENIDNHHKVSRYVNKEMGRDLTHYNFYKNGL
tara:strand:- start:5 stop:499 length:495 start_codon:yes stop_codon:yes gene_type:complete